MLGLFKKSKPTIAREEFEPIIDNLIVMLDESNNTPQADWMKLIKQALVKGDIDDFLKKLISVDVWGVEGQILIFNKLKTLKIVFVINTQ